MLITKIRRFILTAISTVIIIVGCSSSETRSEPGVAINVDNKKYELDESKPIPSNQSPSQVVTNIYLENSGSMFGYVSGDNDFTSAVSDFALHCDLKSNQVNYSLLNGVHTPLGGELSDFLGKLDKAGMDCGKPETSDLNSMFKRVLDNAKDGEISILISDGIYSVSETSPGDLGKKLKLEAVLTQKYFIERLENEDITTYLIKLNSHFIGSYYSYQGGTIQISQSRPYYIWIVGTQNDLKENFPDSYLENLSGFQNIVKFVKLTGGIIKCQYAEYKRIGKIKTSNSSPLVLSDVKPGNKGITRFSIAFDFSEIPYSEDYFLNSKIYQNNLDYIVEDVVPITALTPVAIAGLKGEYTNVVTFSRPSPPWGSMTIVVKDLIPEWIGLTHDIDDSDIIKDTLHTFGFGDLIGGIADAYDHVSESENLFEITFEININ